MGRQEAHAQLREKLEEKMGRLQSKLEQLQDADDIHLKLNDVARELAEVDLKLSSVELSKSESAPELAHLQTLRERLLAQQERLELKLELLAEKRERLQEALEEIQASLAHQKYGAFAAAPPFFSHSSAARSQNMQEERRKILEMVQAGNITADEGARLLDALVEQEKNPPRRQTPRWVRIRVTDAESEKVRVNLTLPVGLVRAGLRAGGSIAGMEGLNTSRLAQMLDRGEVGHLLDIKDTKDGERVEIVVE